MKNWKQVIYSRFYNRKTAYQKQASKSNENKTKSSKPKNSRRKTQWEFDFNFYQANSMTVVFY